MSDHLSNWDKHGGISLKRVKNYQIVISCAEEKHPTSTTSTTVEQEEGGKKDESILGICTITNTSNTHTVTTIENIGRRSSSGTTASQCSSIEVSEGQQTVKTAQTVEAEETDHQPTHQKVRQHLDSNSSISSSQSHEPQDKLNQSSITVSSGVGGGDDNNVSRVILNTKCGDEEVDKSSSGGISSDKVLTSSGVAEDKVRDCSSGANAKAALVSKYQAVSPWKIAGKFFYGHIKC